MPVFYRKKKYSEVLKGNVHGTSTGRLRDVLHIYALPTYYISMTVFYRKKKYSKVLKRDVCRTLVKQAF